MRFELPQLPYAYDALEPHIDARTMEIHHGKHHAAYTNNLNNALESAKEWGEKSIEQILADLDGVPDGIRMAVRNNGGGFANHNLFWTIMGPNGGGEPNGALGKAIGGAFGDFAKFKDELTKAAVGRFGSGWSWLAVDSQGKLKVLATPNQDSLISQGMTPVMGVDVWEHAYYLKYQNRRPDYVAAWWNVVNWAEVGRRFGAATA
ncbi:MAG TPA: superoxide dismutase [Anaerolineales bacterium]|jgi:Fe-Mn family superoxide dismutase|nr:superoxide dismutase [Anaerolineales bacterium]